MSPHDPKDPTTITLLSVDRRKGLAVYEVNGEKVVIEVDSFDRNGNPILTETQHNELLRRRSAKEVIPDEPFSRAIPILDLRDGAVISGGGGPGR
jgi:hypothetical protein